MAKRVGPTVDKALTGLSIAGFVLAGVLTYIGDKFGAPALFSVGMGSLGAAALTAGLQAVLTRSAFFLPSGQAALARGGEMYQGCAAQLWGVLVMLFGLVLGGWSLIDLLMPGSIPGLLDALMGTPLGRGLFSGGAGIVLGLYGWARLLGGPGYQSPGWQGRLRDAWHRAWGGFLVIAGAMLAMLGFVLVVFPDLIPSLLGDWFS